MDNIEHEDTNHSNKKLMSKAARQYKLIDHCVTDFRSGEDGRLYESFESSGKSSGDDEV
jgi:hypothetical protein